MKHQYGYDIYLDNYYSPFPREKSNREVLKYSYAKKLPYNETLIDIPPSVTASYMRKNPFYFDLKKHNSRFNKRPKSSAYNTLTTKQSRNAKSSKKNNYIMTRSNCTIYDSKKLENLMQNDKNKYYAPRPKLNKGCEVMKSLVFKPMCPRPELTPAEVLSVLNKIKYPEAPKGPSYIPNYINEFKIRQMIENEYERLVEEEKGYPPGTFKVWEADRILILKNLRLIREDLIEQLRYFPVDYHLRSIGIRNRRAQIEKRIDEIEYAIRLFELTDVYLKV